MKYQQPHTIRIQFNKLEKLAGKINIALKEKLIEYEHHKAKYQVRYNKSKQSRRIYK